MDADAETLTVCVSVGAAEKELVFETGGEEGDAGSPDDGAATYVMFVTTVAAKNDETFTPEGRRHGSARTVTVELGKAAARSSA